MLWGAALRARYVLEFRLVGSTAEFGGAEGAEAGSGGFGAVPWVGDRCLCLLLRRALCTEAVGTAGIACSALVTTVEPALLLVAHETGARRLPIHLRRGAAQRWADVVHPQLYDGSLRTVLCLVGTLGEPALCNDRHALGQRVRDVRRQRVRKLAYEIDGKTEGNYVVVTYSCEPATSDELDQTSPTSFGLLAADFPRQECVCVVPLRARGLRVRTGVRGQLCQHTRQIGHARTAHTCTLL